MRSRLGFLAAGFLLLISAERPAKAYVDPGSGALIWQTLLAAVVGSAFYFRRFFGWVKVKLFRSKHE